MVSVSGSSILGIIFSLVLIAFLIFNVIYVNAARQVSSTITRLSPTAGTILFWIDIILIVLLGIYLIYNIWLIFTTPEQRVVVKETITRPRAVVPSSMGAVSVPNGSVVTLPEGGTVALPNGGVVAQTTPTFAQQAAALPQRAPSPSVQRLFQAAPPITTRTVTTTTK